MPARVLIADDKPAGTKDLAAKLSDEYYDVVTAANGPAALESIRENEPDLILLGVALPKMNGFEVCQRVKQNPQCAHIPVLLVTSSEDSADKVRGLEAGADEILIRPVIDETLFARVRSLVRFKQTFDQWRLRGETTQKMGFPDSAELSMPDDGRKGRVALVAGDGGQSVAISEALAYDHDHINVIGSFKDAVNRVIRAEPDVVVVSLTAIGEDPLRLCSNLRSLEHTRQLPILLAGDESDTHRLIKALELGVNDYIIFPLDEPELRARVRNLVRRKRYQDRLRTSFLQSLSMALTDSLTGLHNRRYFSTHLEALFRRTTDSGKPLALLIIDIDHFKRVNDTYGHAVGDEVLCDVAQQIARNVRAFDLVARYGGEEFVVLMPDTADAVALAIADRLRDKIADHEFLVGDSAAAIGVTVSIGISYARGPQDDPDDLLKRADKALYQAKDEGRNRVVSEAGEGFEFALKADAR